jgi:NAD(P)-dependent dehydrogenase (short-subunit alcohol dehydrogenase family)
MMPSMSEVHSKTPDLFDVGSKVIVITGGLGQLGSQFARTLLHRGATVVALDVPDQVARARDVLGSWLDSDRLLCLETDVTIKTSIEAALEEVQRRFGVPDGLITCAAIDAPPDATQTDNPPFERYAESAWRRVMDINLTGVFLSCQVVGSAMAEAGRGSIANVSSIYGLVSPDQRLYEYRRERGDDFYKPVAYSVSKSGILNLTRYLATHWAIRGVRVNTLTFGGVFNNQEEAFVRAYSARVPIGRLARVEEYDGAVVFLMSDASSYMTGSNLVIDGGWTAW